MKTIIKFYAIAIILIMSSDAFSQNAHNLVENNPRASLQDVSFLLNSNTEKTEASGSPYITDEFLPVKIKGYKNIIFSGRYNAYSGQMEIKLEDDKTIYLDNDKYYEVTFTILNKTYKTCNYINKEKEKERGFLQIIHKGNGFTLLKQESVKFYDKVPAKSGYDQAKPAQFKKENDKFYIYFKGDDTISYISTRKKDLLKVFPEKSKSLKKYIKDNKLNTTKESDLIKVANYISSL